MDALSNIAVVDMGSLYTKAGISSDTEPTCMIRSLAAKRRQKDTKTNKNYFFGDVAASKRDTWKLYDLITNGEISNWNYIIKFLEYTLVDQLKMDIENTSILIAEPALMPNKYHDGLAEIMFEHLNIPKFCIQNHGALSLYAAGKTTGFVLESGDAISSFMPMQDGQLLSDFVVKNNLAGNAVTNNLISLLNESGQSFDPDADSDIVRNIKEKTTFVSPDFELSVSQLNEKLLNDATYQLPNNETIEVLAKSRFNAPEILFQPMNYGDSINPGIDSTVYGIIYNMENNIQKKMFSNIVLSGGNWMIHGLESRLKNELEKIVSDSPIKIYTSPEAKFNVFIGGTIVSNLPDISSRWVSKQDYQEKGHAAFY